MASKDASGHNPLLDWRPDPSAIAFVGRDLQRPECILAVPDGTLFTADARGGVMRIAPDGTQRLIAQEGPHPPDAPAASPSLLDGTLPNGLAFDRNGDFLISNFGMDRLERMDGTGRTTVLLDSIEGTPLGKVNFVLRDSRNRLWVTVSTRVNPWSDAIRKDLDDGYVVLIDARGARIVADGLHFTNELRLDAREAWLYVAETTAKRITRFRVTADGSLVDREIFGPSSLGRGLIDGIAFDACGNLWGTMILADRLIALTPRGDLIELLDDGDRAGLDRFEAAFATGRPVPFETMLGCGGTLAPLITSVTFGGPDLRTVYLGSLKGDRLPAFRSPVAGQPMAHWRF